MNTPLWTPSESRIARSQLVRFMRVVAESHGVRASSMEELWRWSVEAPEAFWAAIWDFCEVTSATRGDVVLEDGELMPGARWFPQARLNFAQNLLRRHDEDRPAIIAWGEKKIRREVSWADLQRSVSQLAHALLARGVGPGDRVAGLLPNIPEAVVAMLACSSIGAVWSSCSPDFGAAGVLDRFGQIEPKVLFACDGYYYAGKVHMSVDRLAAILDALPTVEFLITVPYVGSQPLGLESEIALHDLVADQPEDENPFASLPFDHPLYVMYSSGTTGKPKCIVHGAGGTLLQHLKEHRLHCDIVPEDRVF